MENSLASLCSLQKYTKAACRKEQNGAGKITSVSSGVILAENCWQLKDYVELKYDIKRSPIHVGCQTMGEAGGAAPN